MILVDANLLIYAHVSTFSQHEKAREWIDTFEQILCIALAEPISRLKLSMRSTPSVRLASGVCVERSASLVHNVQATGCAPKRVTT